MQFGNVANRRLDHLFRVGLVRGGSGGPRLWHVQFGNVANRRANLFWVRFIRGGSSGPHCIRIVVTVLIGRPIVRGRGLPMPVGRSRVRELPSLPFVQELLSDVRLLARPKISRRRGGIPHICVRVVVRVLVKMHHGRRLALTARRTGELMRVPRRTPRRVSRDSGRRRRPPVPRALKTSHRSAPARIHIGGSRLASKNCRVGRGVPHTTRRTSIGENRLLLLEEFGRGKRLTLLVRTLLYFCGCTGSTFVVVSSFVVVVRRGGECRWGRLAKQHLRVR